MYIGSLLQQVLLRLRELARENLQRKIERDSHFNPIAKKIAGYTGVQGECGKEASSPQETTLGTDMSCLNFATKVQLLDNYQLLHQSHYKWLCK